jgi:hypothetical protein
MGNLLSSGPADPRSMDFVKEQIKGECVRSDIEPSEDAITPSLPLRT